MFNSITRFANKQLYLLKDHIPEILAGVGVVASTGAIIFTVKKSKENVEIIENHQEEMYQTETKVDKAKVYCKTAFNFVKANKEAVVLQGISVLSTINGAKIGRNKYVSLIGTAATMQSIHEAYRQNVIEKYGQEVDNEMRYGLKDTTNYISKNGKPVTLVDENGSKIKVADRDFENCDISRIFDETNPKYVRDAYYNKEFIIGVQRAMNNRLRNGRGYVYLNDVYEALGFEPTEAGHDLGWVYKDKTTDDVRKHHNYIEIRTVDAWGNDALDFENGLEPSVILDFNIDGYITNEIKWEKKKNK